MSKNIVSVQRLKDNIDHENLVVIDASQGKTASGETSNFEGFQLHGALFFDIKNVFSDQESGLSNTLPSAVKFEKECQKLGINQDSIIVVYDNLGIYYSPRVLWMFKTMGHKEIYVLDGGLPEWSRLGNAIIPKKESIKTSGNFKSTFKPEKVKNLDFMLQNITQNESVVIDARSPDRFSGIKKEPRANAKSGHIPKSINIHYKSVLTDGCFKPKNELSRLFEEKGISNAPIVFTCGSGITACIMLLASEMILENTKSVYDGSWNEWGQTEGLPIEV